MTPFECIDSIGNIFCSSGHVSLFFLCLTCLGSLGLRSLPMRPLNFVAKIVTSYASGHDLFQVFVNDISPAEFIC